jgi:hypothetical protein
MTIVELQAKVASAEEKVVKCQGTIQRHVQQLEKKMKSNALSYEIESKQEDIKGASRKLRDAQEILQNWYNKLNVAVEKERFLEGNAPQVIKDFLEHWKRLAFDWHIKRYNAFQVFKKELHQEEVNARFECIKTHPEFSRYIEPNGQITAYIRESYGNLINVHPRNIMDTYLKEHNLYYSQVNQRLASFAGQAVLKMCEFRDEGERLQWLEKMLEADKKAKMLDLITRINSVVGSMTNADRLSVDPKGNLNGIIQGTHGAARVETIGAGGWNIQCFHFRTLVHKL